MFIYKNNAKLSKFARTHSKFWGIPWKTKIRAIIKSYQKEIRITRATGKLWGTQQLNHIENIGAEKKRNFTYNTQKDLTWNTLRLPKELFLPACIWGHCPYRYSKIYRFRLKCHWGKIRIASFVFKYRKGLGLDCWRRSFHVGTRLNKSWKRYLNSLNIGGLWWITETFGRKYLPYLSSSAPRNWFFNMAQKYHINQIAWSWKGLSPWTGTGSQITNESKSSGKKA